MGFKKLFTFIFTLLLTLNFCLAQTDAAIDKAAEKTAKKTAKADYKANKIEQSKKEKAAKKEKTVEKKTVEKPAKTTTKSEESTAESSGGGSAIFDKLSISASAGMNHYYGDIADYNYFPKTDQFGTQVAGGFKFSIARDIKWGLGVQLNYQKGDLKGTRKTGKNSSVVSFENHFSDVSLQARYLLSDLLF